jgi:acyl-coenzyme A synthetase/AMP-(fatty) acid ligase
VYDIFGLLSAGGTIVIPSTKALSPPDPSIWHDIMQSEGITVWNTVPAFMELLVSQLESADCRLPASLRLIYLSGDWIPISLPRRIKALSENADLRIISLGGATEASIWSNIYEIDDVIHLI